MAPVMLVIGDDAADRCVAVQTFAARGWTARGAAGDQWREIAQAAPPSLLVVGRMRDTAILPALRAAPQTMAAPVVAWTAAPPESLLASGYDEVLPADAPRGLAALAERWRPLAPWKTLERLRAMLGPDEIDQMLDRLRVHLETVLNTPSQEEAHRIAGIAGMFGFDALGSAWLAVSQGDDAARPRARIATRQALFALAQWHNGRDTGEETRSAPR